MGSEPNRTHATTWILSALGALLLYVATWPLIEIKCSDVSISHIHDLSGKMLFTIDPEPPSWVRRLYGPLHSLRDYGAGSNNPVQQYWNWWCKFLDRPGFEGT